MSDEEKAKAREELAQLKKKLDADSATIQKAIDECREAKVASEDKLKKMQREVDDLSKRLRGEYLLLLDNLDSQTRVR